MKDNSYIKVPVFENVLAPLVFPFTDGKTGENYNPATSDIIRYCVYVESDYERDRFYFLVKWLHSNHIDYADCTGSIITKVD